MLVEKLILTGFYTDEKCCFPIPAAGLYSIMWMEIVFWKIKERWFDFLFM